MGTNLANGIAQPICNSATDTCTADLIVEAKNSSAHLVIDVVGYFAAATGLVGPTGPQGPTGPLRRTSTRDRAAAKEQLSASDWGVG